MPCVMNQVEGSGVKELVQEGAVIHAETECRGCLVSPIQGIRYKCQICIDFSLCEKCEATVDHSHNLLKMKKAAEDEKRIDKPLPWFFKLLNQGWDSSKDKPRRKHSHSRLKRSPEALERMFFEKKCRKLSKIYGGEPEQYREFVQANRDLKIRQTLLKYLEVNEEKADVSNKLVSFKANKLSQWLDKPAENYTEFVKANLTRTPREMFKMLIETGAEERPAKSPRRCKRESKDRTKEDRPSREERKASRQAWKEQREQMKKVESPEKKETETVSPEKKEKKKFSPMKMKEGGQGRGRGKMIQTMIDLFGRKDIKEYLRLIEEHGQEGQERVVELYIEQLSK